MEGTSINLFQGFLIGTLLILFFVVFLILFVVVYKRRQERQERRLLEIEAQYQRELLAATVTTQEKERERIARDLHDEVGAMLSTINLGLLKFQREAKAIPQAEKFTSSTKKLIDQTADEVRRIARDLLPATLGKFGLEAALEDLFGEMERQSGNRILWEYGAGKLEPEQSLGLYRILQEASNNSLKYAQNSTLHCWIGERGEEILLHYQDEGPGFVFDEAFRKNSLGLKNISSRAEVLGGKAQIWSAPGEGMRLEVKIPLKFNPAHSSPA